LTLSPLLIYPTPVVLPLGGSLLPVTPITAALAPSSLDDLSINQSQSIKWTQIETFLREWWYEPDINALKILIAACRAHFIEQSLPVWVMVVGAPGKGKTTMVDPLAAFGPQVTRIGTISTNTLISAKKGAPSLLMDGGLNHIFLFPDFSSIITMRSDERTEFSSQMRQVFDGKYSKLTGERGIQTWTGKVTAIAAATYAVERMWTIDRELGDRFYTVRWKSGPDSDIAAQYAFRQVGKKRALQKQLQSMIADFISDHLLPTVPEVPQPLREKVIPIACVVAHARCPVAHNWKGEIEDVDEPEYPTRLISGMSQIMSSWADLMGREVDKSDLDLARRFAYGSIPRRRSDILQAIPWNDEATFSDILLATQMPKSTLSRVLNDLQAIHLILYDTSTETYYLENKIMEWLSQT
jgi:hypothetical protein